MVKLKDHEFEFLVNVALDTKDEKMFKDIMKRQEEGKFLDFPVGANLAQKEVLSFAAKEKQRLIKDMENITNAYKNKLDNQDNLYDLIDDLGQAIDFADERLANQAFMEEGTMALSMSPVDFPVMPMEYVAISHDIAIEAYEKHRFPNESLDAFVARYFFGDGIEGKF